MGRANRTLQKKYTIIKFLTMKRLFLILITLFCHLVIQANNPDSLALKTIRVKLHYLNREPFFFSTENKFQGIEKEIIDQFADWARTRKNTHLVFEYVAHPDFNSLILKCKEEKDAFLGSGTVTIKDERSKFFHFSPPYLKNISILISHPGAGRLDGKNLKAAAVKNSVHQSHLNELIQTRGLQAESILIENQLQLPDLIHSDSTVIGYMDLLNYWSFVNQHPDKHLKIHRSASRDHEAFGFICKQQSELAELLDAFFSAGFGFTATRKYDAILKKYLGNEVMSAVEVNE